MKYEHYIDLLYLDDGEILMNDKSDSFVSKGNEETEQRIAKWISKDIEEVCENACNDDVLHYGPRVDYVVIPILNDPFVASDTPRQQLQEFPERHSIEELFFDNGYAYIFDETVRVIAETDIFIYNVISSTIAKDIKEELECTPFDLFGFRVKYSVSVITEKPIKVVI